MHRFILVALAACSTPTTPIANEPATGAAHYAILAEPMVGANGITPNGVRVLGWDAQGAPALDPVVLGTSRPGSGHFTSPRLTLGPGGAQTAFIACDKSATGCLGPVSLEVALASAPSVPIAHVDLAIVDPLLVDPAKQCRTGGNVLYVKGDDQIFTGEETLGPSATWTTNTFSDAATIDVATATESFELQFNTSRVQSVSMFTGPYLDATLAQNQIIGSQPVGYPAMNIARNGTACSMITGQFQILDIAHTGDPTFTTTIVFEQHCEGSATTALRGCVHVQP